MAQRRNIKGRECLLPSIVSVAAALCSLAPAAGACGAEAVPAARKRGRLARDTVYFPKAFCDAGGC